MFSVVRLSPRFYPFKNHEEKKGGGEGGGNRTFNAFVAALGGGVISSLS